MKMSIFISTFFLYLSSRIKIIDVFCCFGQLIVPLINDMAIYGMIKEAALAALIEY